MKKYPDPIEKEGRYHCPVDGCKKSYAHKRGYRRHYRKKHYTKLPKSSKGDKKQILEVVDQVSQKVLSNIKSRKRLEAKIKESKGLKDTSWLLMLGDYHYGLKVNSMEVGGLGEYNSQIARDRINLLADDIVRVRDYHINAPDTLHIAFLGDMVDNSIMRGNQYGEVEFGVAQQVIEASELLVDFLIKLSGAFKKIKCYGVFGNHGRITKNYKDSKREDNFDRIIYHIIKKQISDMEGIKFEYTKSQHMLVDVSGWRFWLEHGDSVRGWSGLPFYGARREKANIQNMLSTFKESSDYVIMGHHHSKAEFLDIFINGAFPGGSKYSIGKLRKMNLPYQLLLGITKKRGVVWKRNLLLADNIRDKKIKIYK